MKHSLRTIAFYARALAALALCALAPDARAGFTQSGTISSWGQTLSDGVVYTVPQTMTVSAWGGYDALQVRDNAKAVIYIPSNVTLTVYGGSTSGTTGAGAAIKVPSTSSLVVTG